MAQEPTRRRHTRYPCTGGVEIRRNEGVAGIFASLTDISMQGCYVETVSTLPAETEVVFMVRVRDTVIRGRALVKTSNHAVGMGLEFMHLATEDQQKLEFLVGTLAGIQDMRAPDQRTVVAEEPVRIPPPLTTTRPVPTASMTRPSPARATAAAPRSAAISSSSSNPVSQKIMSTLAELNQLEQNLVKEQVDPRLIAQMHDAMEHLRQTAWTVQQFLDLSACGGDPFEVLPQLEAERMQMLGKLAHNVNADIDSTSVNEFTLGVSELYETIQGLYRRLHRMLIGDAAQ
ncbi:MAG TPA: PilZ domain-containing protein [Candidatus Angelobacter sp.]|nr:PilZ domain-containing protein [Candidatus Angelobacter sp.]